MEGNVITQSGSCGITVEDGSNPTIRSNRIEKTASSGIVYDQNGSGLLQHNLIFAAGNAGIVVSRGSDPDISRNVVHNSKGSGVWVRKGGSGRITDNHIGWSTGPALFVEEGGNPFMEANGVVSSKGSGLTVDNMLQGVVGPTLPSALAVKIVDGVMVESTNQGLPRNVVFDTTATAIFSKRQLDWDPLIVDENGQRSGSPLSPRAVITVAGPSHVLHVPSRTSKMSCA